MTDISNLPRLRYRRFGGGYRRDEVLFHLRELEATVRGLEAELAAARGRSQELSLEVGTARAELAGLRLREHQIDEAIESANRRASDVVEAAEIKARVVLAEAEEQAARIRGEAHLRIDDIGKQLEEILRLRETMLTSLKGVLQDVGVALGRVERNEPVFGPAVEPPPAPSSPAPAHPEVPASAPVPGDEALFGRRVEIDAGPFPDFATLSAFERSLGALPNVEDVYVRRFGGDRATIELTTSYEQPLLQLLRGTLPYGFEAERHGPDALRITIAAASLAGKA
jgi:vacuolar-type H+-ATPase subunit H